MKIFEGAPQTRAEVFKPEIEKIVRALGFVPAETFITDESSISDFVSIGTRPDLAKLSDTLGVVVKDAREMIVDVAERMRAAGPA